MVVGLSWEAKEIDHLTQKGPAWTYHSRCMLQESDQGFQFLPPAGPPVGPCTQCVLEPGKFLFREAQCPILGVYFYP